MKKLIVVLLCLGLCGCGLMEMAQVQDSRNNLSKLNLNMTTEQARQIMGNPYSTETFLMSDNKTALVWNYQTEWTRNPYGHGHRTENTPLVFKDNLLIGWGANFYQSIVSPNAQKENIQLNIKPE